MLKRAAVESTQKLAADIEKSNEKLESIKAVLKARGIQDD